MKKTLAFLMTLSLVFAIVGGTAAFASEEGDLSSVIGSMEDGVYVNDYFNITCTLDEGWTFFTNEEILQMQGMAADMLEDTDYEGYMEEFMNNSSSCIVMGAYSEDMLQNVNVVVESLEGLGEYLSEEEIISMVLSELGLDDDPDLSALGMEGGVLETITCQVAGQEHSGLRIAYADDSLGVEISVVMEMVFILEGDYAMQITMTCYMDETGVDTMTGFFAPLD